MTSTREPTAADGQASAGGAGALGATARRGARPVDYLLVVAIQLAVIWPLARTRGFDWDEGFYAMAAKLVAHGREPYFDFWFQYTPGLPYVYGTWTRITGDSFESLRALSAVLTVALGVILFAHVTHRFSRRLGLVAVVLYISTGLLFSWYSTYKSYVLSVLLVFVAYVLVADADSDKRVRAARWFGAGAFLGLSIDVRLFFVALVAVFAYYAIDRKGSGATRFRDIIPLVGGLIIGLLPCLYFFVRGPRRFVYDTVLSHSSRSLTPLDSIVQRLRTIGVLFAEAQFLILVIATVMLGILLFATRRRLPLAVALAVALALASLIPSPSYDQYFSTLVPFLVVGVIELWDIVRTALPPPRDQRLAVAIRSIVIAGLLLYVVAGVQAFDSMMNSGDGLLVDARTARSIAEEIDAHTRDGEVVIAFAPIDLYESHARPLPGLESNFGASAAANLNLSDAEASRLKLVTAEKLEAIIRSQEVRTVVISQDYAFLGSFANAGYIPGRWGKILADSGYLPVATVHNRTIYQLP